MTALEQLSVIKFCVVNKKSRQETFEMLKMAFGNSATKETASSKAIILLLVNRDQVAPHPSQQRKLKQSKSCCTLDCRMTIGL